MMWRFIAKTNFNKSGIELQFIQDQSDKIALTVVNCFSTCWTNGSVVLFEIKHHRQPYKSVSIAAIQLFQKDSGLNYVLFINAMYGNN
ncbi:hypothetical protein TNIN_300331 [Trichonephila inaurata madagascariensis]|uniref:Uncharacterized protein n=1 Tax=Trichonephila inaurata madagascariensis TaxID=2747483 RepID=A0A8X6JE36_9ARAC|nr:hypothetical protein TNIN_300331 [Trichonephila inaurata madagascariensis]